jgi:molybdopterin-guanine dinucleotide biosynthesis protein A
MVGLVLSGGQSTRMGFDKGLISHETTTWVQIAYEKLKEVVADVFVSINSLQSKEYTELLGEETIILDNPKIPVKGPLLGILSAHLKNPDQDLLVMACDMRDLSPAIIQKLVSNYVGQTALTYSNEEYAEPLMGIYSSPALKTTYQSFLNGETNRFSMMYILDKIKAEHVMIPTSELPKFKNYNSIHDFS